MLKYLAVNCNLPFKKGTLPKNQIRYIQIILMFSKEISITVKNLQISKRSKMRNWWKLVQNAFFIFMSLKKSVLKPKIHGISWILRFWSWVNGKRGIHGFSKTRTQRIF